MDNTGWIKVYRSMKKHWIWSNSEYLKAWLCILMECNHTEAKVLIKGKLLTCGRGESLKSLQTWAKEFGYPWTIQKVRTFFNLLKNDEMINTVNEYNTTRLTICNYDTYQDQQHAQIIKPTGKQQAPNTQVTTNNNEKKEKNENIDDHKAVYEIFWKAYPGPKPGLNTAFEHFKKVKGWQQVLPLLFPALSREIQHKANLKAAGEFCPTWRNLKTWQNNNGWEDQFPTLESKPEQKPVFNGIIPQPALR